VSGLNPLEVVMAQVLPIDAVVEYRGMAPASEFARDGQKIEIAPKLKFEHEDASGDVQLIPVPRGQLDEARPPFNADMLKRGDRVRLLGEAVIQEPSARNPDGSPKRSYFRVRSVVPADDVAPGTRAGKAG
jgi:hypothetical protein